MPITVTCSSCRNTVQVPDQYAGRKGTCRKCGGPIDVPTAEPEEADDEPMLLVLDDDDEAIVPGGPKVRTEAPSPMRAMVPAMTPEPLYYKFLAIYGWVLFYGGIIIWLVWSVIVVMGFVSSRPTAGMLLFLPLILAAPGLVLVGCLFLGGMVLLAVDAARTMRVIRLQTHILASKS